MNHTKARAVAENIVQQDDAIGIYEARGYLHNGDIPTIEDVDDACVEGGVEVAAAYLALLADRDGVVNRAELLGAADGWGACRSLLVSGTPPEQVMRIARDNETELRRLANTLEGKP